MRPSRDVQSMQLVKAKLNVSICQFWITDQVSVLYMIIFFLTLQDIVIKVCSSTIQISGWQYRIWLIHAIGVSGKWWNRLLLVGSFEAFGWCLSVKRNYECDTIITWIQECNTIIACFPLIQLVTCISESRNYEKIAMLLDLQSWVNWGSKWQKFKETHENLLRSLKIFFLSVIKMEGWKLKHVSNF